MKLPTALRERRNQVIALFILATLVLTSISLLLWLTGYSARHANLMKFVYFEPSIPGRDLTGADRFLEWRQFGAGVFFQPGTKNIFNFCPFAFFVILFFLNLPHPLPSLILCVAAAVLISAAFLARAIGDNRLAIGALIAAVCTSYPFAFLFERGNIEGTVWIPSVLGVYFFAREKYLAATLWFALAACIKPFPAMLFLLLLFRRRYREFAIGVSIVAVVSAVCLAIIGPTFAVALRENIRGFQLVNREFVLVYLIFEIGHDHSLFSFIKQVIRLLSGWPLQETLSGTIRKVYPFYMVSAVLLFCASIYRLYRLPMLNQIFGISVLMILISPINNDYTLIAIYIPWAILLYALSRPDCAIPFKSGCCLMLLCAVIFTPQSYLLVGYAAFGAQVKTLALLAILLISVTYPLPVPMLDESPATIPAV